MTSLAIGLMSGTSLDGIDAALVRIAGQADAAVVRSAGHADVSLEAFHSRPFDAAFRRSILSLLAHGTVRDIAQVNVEVGARLAQAALDLIEDAKVAPTQLTFIASHGLTVWHEPRHSSLQIGDPATIAERTGVQVVSDFRSRDVAAGGHGAPLVPMVDAVLFGHPQRGRVLLNLGGMANVTWVPVAGAIDDVIAFDTGPGVAVVDAVVRRATGDPFDRDGRLAGRGTPVEDVVNTLLEHAYFRQAPPKSTGRELFGDAFADDLVRRVGAARVEATVADSVATAVLLSCRAVKRGLEAWVPMDTRTDVVVSGGGARNSTILACLRAELEQSVCLFDDVFFDGDAKEAVAFAYLGWLTLAGKPGNVPTATGARGPRVLGCITPA